jgi:murein DD-endopeptidase MepM/ murein hydrolase activator NlpD
VQRRPSPLLHDYKAPRGPKTSRNRPLGWFVAGLGLPLALTAAVIALSGSPDERLDPVSVSVPEPASSPLAQTSATPAGPAEQPMDTAAMEAAVFSPALSWEPVLDNYADFHPPMAYPVPDYESLLVTIERGDTLDRIFRRNDLDLGDLAEIARLPEAKDHLRMLRPGDEVEIRHDGDGDVVGLFRALELTSALEVSRGKDGFSASIVERPVEKRRRIAYGRIESSLFESGADAGLSDKMIMNLAGIFAWDVDFVLDIRRDDNYYIIYEELWQDGEYAADGDIVAAEFNNNGRTYKAVRYADDNGRSDYFTPEGRSVRKAFVRAPVDFTRISSSFNPRRRHPILNTIRAHRGVDYAAPRGTPVKAAGDGKIIFRGVKGGYGNAVILQHGGNITTLYAHLNGFDRNALINQRVKQGQTIGYVGDSGLATAPHLHYEYRLNGVHRNPRTVKLPQAEPIGDRYMQDFLALARPILEELEAYKQTRVASLSAD